jgi:uncharacterized oxidoreductase
MAREEGNYASCLEEALKPSLFLEFPSNGVADIDSNHMPLVHYIGPFTAGKVTLFHDDNAGVMRIDDAADAIDEAQLVSTVTTNLLGPIRLTSALIDHLKTQESSIIIYNSSVLAYVPLALAAVYSSTKAALHSYALSQRYKLKDTSVSVLEIAPPWVQTGLFGSKNEPRAMPLSEFIEETIRVLGTDVHEVLVERAKPLRNNPGPNEGAFVTEFNDLMIQAPA